jgi:STE24 endopeptidase
LLVLPLDAWAEVVLRRYGLSTRSWGGWVADVSRSYAVMLVLTLIALFAFYGLLRWSPRWWWAFGALTGALLVVVASFAYPVVVEPVFNKFTSLPAGELRTSLTTMAARDGVPVRDVLVADASRRTTSLNAYVSGFGATRRIVVYDTLLDRASPDEVRLVVAHELGHAKRRDVLWGTLLGALGVAALVVFLALVLQSAGLLRRAGVVSAADPRSMALVLAVVAVVGFAFSPVQTLVSRRIEARADVHALDLTRDPETFAQMQRRLAVSNLSDLDPPPLVYLLFATHPTAPQRIALARNWALVHGAPPPPPLAR